MPTRAELAELLLCTSRMHGDLVIVDAILDAPPPGDLPALADAVRCSAQRVQRAPLEPRVVVMRRAKVCRRAGRGTASAPPCTDADDCPEERWLRTLTSMSKDVDARMATSLSACVQRAPVLASDRVWISDPDNLTIVARRYVHEVLADQVPK